MFYLIDGYNLLHQTPLLTRDRNDGWLQRARERLVGFIRTKLASDDSTKATIVFDTQRSAPSLGDSIDYGNVQVLFARSHDEADDLLEELIEQCRTPSSLCVVSSDRRVQAAGKRFHAKEIIDSRAWFEWLESLPDSNDNGLGQDLPKVDPRWIGDFAGLHRGGRCRLLATRIWIDLRRTNAIWKLKVTRPTQRHHQSQPDAGDRCGTDRGASQVEEALAKTQARSYQDNGSSQRGSRSINPNEPGRNSTASQSSTSRCGESIRG